MAGLVRREGTVQLRFVGGGVTLVETVQPRRRAGWLVGVLLRGLRFILWKRLVTHACLRQTGGSKAEVRVGASVPLNRHLLRAV